MSIRVGSILHGAYGDYYEQMVAFRLYKRLHPDHQLVLFFASESRRRELAVFDLSFADEVHPAAAIPHTPVDKFFQFQVRDRELRADILDRLPPEVAARFDLRTLHKPWHWVRKAWRTDRELCDLSLSQYGQAKLPEVMAGNGVGPDFFRDRMTIAFLWRYRSAEGPITNKGQRPQAEIIQSVSAILQHFVDRFGATVMIAGMNLTVDVTNRERTDCKFTDQVLSVNGDCRYLKGLNWGLELETLRQCTLCYVMASGFSEALWLKRGGRDIVLIDPPRDYVVKLMYNRMPLFSVCSPGNLYHHLARSHTTENVLRFTRSRTQVTV